MSGFLLLLLGCRSEPAMAPQPPDTEVVKALADPSTREEVVDDLVSGRLPWTDDLVQPLTDALGPDLLAGLAPHLSAHSDPDVVVQLLPTTPPGVCESLRLVRRRGVTMPHVWVAEAMVACPGATLAPHGADLDGLAVALVLQPGPAVARRRLLKAALKITSERSLLLADALAQDEDPVWLVGALREVELAGGDEGVQRRVVVLAGHQAERVRRGALGALATQWPDTALPILLASLDDMALRHDALELLVFLHHDARTDILLGIANDPGRPWAHARVRQVLGVED